MRVLLLALLVLLAGCGAPASDPEPSPSATAQASSGTGAVHPVPPVQPPAVADAPEPYQANGTADTAACVSTPAATECEVLVPGSPFTVMFPDGWDVVGVDLELTWSEGNEIMGFGIVRDDNGTLVADHDRYVEGTSPLAIDLDLADLAGQRLGYHVGSYTGAGAGGVSGSASPGQDWALAGTVLVRKAA